MSFLAWTTGVIIVLGVCMFVTLKTSSRRNEQPRDVAILFAFEIGMAVFFIVKYDNIMLRYALGASQ